MREKLPQIGQQDKRRKTRPRGRVPASAEKPLPPRETPPSTPEATAPIFAKTRYAIVAAMGLVMAGAGAVAYGLTDSTQKAPAPHASVETKKTAPNEIVLGGVRFYLQSPEKFTPNEKKDFFDTLQRAYSRLTTLLGEENIHVDDLNMEIPLVIISLNPDNDRGDIQYQITIGDATQNGDPEITAAKVTAMHIQRTFEGKLHEQTVAHELFHLLYQGSLLTPASFGEGHAHAVDEILYGKPSFESEKMVQQPGAQKMFDRGLDDTGFDRSIGEGLSKDHHSLDNWRKADWTLRWKKYEETHPGFLRNFYAAYQHARKSGKQSFDKDDLIKIAHQVSPDFLEWYRNQPSLKFLDENGGYKKVDAFYSPSEKKIMIANYETVRRTNGFHTPRKVKLVYDGAMELVLYDASERQTKIIHLNTQVLSLMMINVDIYEQDIHKMIPRAIRIGGHEIQIRTD